MGRFKGNDGRRIIPRDDIHNLENELKNLKMKGSDIKAYTTRFNDISLLRPKLVTSEH